MLLQSEFIHHQTFSARLQLVDLLTTAATERAGDSSSLRKSATQLDDCAIRFGDSKIGTCGAAMADLVRIAAHLVDWKKATLEAEVDADRFLRAAQEHLKIWKSEHSSRQENAEQANI